MIVMGATLWPLTKLDIYGSLRADGQNYENATTNSNGTLSGGLGDSCGGTILLFIQVISLFDNSFLSVAGGRGVPIGGGGGGGGRVHFYWSKIGAGNEYIPLAVINSTINTWWVHYLRTSLHMLIEHHIITLVSCLTDYYNGGEGDGEALPGEDGTITRKECPKGLYCTFCEECPIGTFKDVEGSDYDLKTRTHTHTQIITYTSENHAGGVFESFFPYKCRLEKYRMPNCYTPLEELIYTFGLWRTLAFSSYYVMHCWYGYIVKRRKTSKNPAITSMRVERVRKSSWKSF